jgi:hypothetical protein
LPLQSGEQFPIRDTRAFGVAKIPLAAKVMRLKEKLAKVKEAMGKLAVYER